MFGGIANLSTPSTIGPPPEDVPSPTPVTLPNCNLQQHSESVGCNRSKEKDGLKYASLVRFLQTIHRPAELNESHFAALGVSVHRDAPAEDVLPGPSYLPSVLGWDDITVDDLPSRDPDFRRSLSNGNKSPEARVYLERRQELSVENQAAFRTVRRIKPDPGTKQARLGNCYEFYRQLELMATYWDDTSLSPVSHENIDRPDLVDKYSTSEPRSRPHPIDSSIEQAELAVSSTKTTPETNIRSPEPKSKSKNSQRVTYRTAVGSSMPAELRHGLITAFLKVVSYDFGCNISAPRVEPRLHLLEPPSDSGKPQRASYFPSGCVFVYRTPTTREAARSGVVEGPLAAVSARNTTNFVSSSDSNIDFGRELVAALVTAQHRNREGKEEKRVGEGKWWATAKRWGGGEGWPIARETEANGVVGDTGTTTGSIGSDKTLGVAKAGSKTKSQGKDAAATHHSPSHRLSPTSGLPIRGAPANKKARENLRMYDNYRMVRLPVSNWDRKTRYTAIGKQTGTVYDDVFVISSLFHHISILRVRVPERLLEVMAGGKEEDKKSWGQLEVWRSKWFDLFLVEERLEALRLIWGVMAWSMRGDRSNGQDKKMKGT